MSIDNLLDNEFLAIKARVDSYVYKDIITISIAVDGRIVEVRIFSCLYHLNVVLSKENSLRSMGWIRNMTSTFRRSDLMKWQRNNGQYFSLHFQAFLRYRRLNISTHFKFEWRSGTASCLPKLSYNCNFRCVPEYLFLKKIFSQKKHFSPDKISYLLKIVSIELSNETKGVYLLLPQSQQ